MRKIFHKAITVLSSIALVGSSIGAAAAVNYPDPFTSNTAVVYGANAALSDQQAAMDIVANLDSVSDGDSTLEGGEGITETEVPLGGSIVSGKITATLSDSKIPSLLDDVIAWDDGAGNDDYNVQEQLVISNMNLKTTLDDNEFEENVALTNDKGIEYRFVFDDAFNSSGVGGTDADDLYLTILGKSYEVTGMTSTAFTVVTSEEFPLKLGESAIVGGKTFTVEDMSSTGVRVNGETITTTGGAKKIDGLRVKIKSGSIFYNENFPETASVTLQIGQDISKTYANGEEYVGEDENDPEWVWTYSNPGVAAGYIGVKYNYKQTRDTDDVAYEGGSYILPENFAEVKFDGLTDVSYEDFKVYFDLTEDLWNSTDLTSTAQKEDQPVLIIEAVNGDKDAIKLTDGTETNKMYLRWADADDDTQGENAGYGALEVFYSDVNGEVSDAVKPRFSTRVNATDDGEFATADLGDLIVGDTEVQVNASAASGGLALTLTDNGAAKNITIDVGGAALANTTGTLKWLGSNTEATSKEVAETSDVAVQGTNVGTYDYDVMTYDGLIVKAPETNAENDQVLISVPSDRVYGIVSVLAGGEAAGGETGALLAKDTETTAISSKNLIVVGGSAINAVAADLLGAAYRGDAFTTATGIKEGEFLIQSFDRSGKRALLVAGYSAPDTEKGVTYLLNEDVDTTVGKKYKGTSATEATVVVA